jgi:hypothetical protein
MKKLLLVFITFTLHEHAKAQLDEGAYFFIGESQYVDLNLDDEGWSISIGTSRIR